MPITTAIQTKEYVIHILIIVIILTITLARPEASGLYVAHTVNCPKMYIILYRFVWVVDA